MKKKLTVIALLMGIFVSQVKADDICTDWGRFNLCLPITTGVDAAFGYDFRGHQSQGLAETPFGSVRITETSVLVFKAGGITTENGRGAPFAGADYQLKGIKNPVPGIATIQPGIYAGHDFHTNESFYGLKAAIQIFN